MSKIQVTGCISLFLLLAGSSFAAPFTNGDFETGLLTPWYQAREVSEGEDWNITSVDVYSGTFSATNTGNKEIRQDFDEIPSDKIVELSFWAKHIGPAGAIGGELFYSDGTRTSWHFSTSRSDTDYEFFNVTASLVPGKQLTGFSIFGNRGSGGITDFPRTIIDDVTLAVIPEPSSLVLTVITMVGLGHYCRPPRRTASCPRW